MAKKSRGRKQPKTTGVNTRAPEALLKFRIRRHFNRIGFIRADDGSLVPPGTEKEVIRAFHLPQRLERLNESAAFVERALPKALPFFANGWEIDPKKTELRLIRVRSNTDESDLFRIASMTWTVPVSLGYGRRLR